MNALQAKKHKQASDKQAAMFERELQTAKPVVYKSDAMGYIKGVKK